MLTSKRHCEEPQATKESRSDREHSAREIASLRSQLTD